LGAHDAAPDRISERSLAHVPVEIGKIGSGSPDHLAQQVAMFFDARENAHGKSSFGGMPVEKLSRRRWRTP
jgi:hypothetical protein